MQGVIMVPILLAILFGLMWGATAAAIGFFLGIGLAVLAIIGTFKQNSRS